ncbi:hypothetical protein WI604_17805 [Bradyrhizobium symbiodeficiens]|uniref:hypothetical protein n=1 Tax=Bradyrhizobium symbiodeficiens TaxID=1404367 RepID=UPI0030CAB6DC
MADETQVTEAKSKLAKADFTIDFIDPLFAVAIHIGFVEGLLNEHWLHERVFPHTWADFANLALFVSAFWTIVASWVGYHKSIQSKPIMGQRRFVLDILLLALYIFLLLYFRDPIAEAIILAAIFTLYISWDFYKTVEYSDRYYNSAPVPSGLVFLSWCFAEWLQPGRHIHLRSEAITVGWTAFFFVLIPLALLPLSGSDGGKFAFAAIFVLANTIYRYDKGSQGTWICSIPFKIFIAAIIGYLVLYHTKVLCF